MRKGAGMSAQLFMAMAAMMDTSNEMVFPFSRGGYDYGPAPIVTAKGSSGFAGNGKDRKRKTNMLHVSKKTRAKHRRA